MNRKKIVKPKIRPKWKDCKKTQEFKALYLKATPQFQDKIRRMVFAAYAKQEYLKRKALDSE